MGPLVPAVIVRFIYYLHLLNLKWRKNTKCQKLDRWEIESTSSFIIGVVKKKTVQSIRSEIQLNRNWKDFSH